MKQWCNDTDREKLKYWEKKHYTVSAVDKWNTSAEHWWDDTDRGKPAYLEKTLAQYHFVHHKSHVNCPAIESGPLQHEAGD
jgi:hypothetical protein